MSAAHLAPCRSVVLQWQPCHQSLQGHSSEGILSSTVLLHGTALLRCAHLAHLQGRQLAVAEGKSRLGFWTERLQPVNTPLQQEEGMSPLQTVNGDDHCGYSSSACHAPDSLQVHSSRQQGDVPAYLEQCRFLRRACTRAQLAMQSQRLSGPWQALRESSCRQSGLKLSSVAQGEHKVYPGRSELRWLGSVSAPPEP